MLELVTGVFAQTNRIRSFFRSASRKGKKRGRSFENLESRQLLALTIANLPAEDVSTSSATIGVDIIETGNSDPTITIFWGDEDGGGEQQDEQALEQYREAARLDPENESYREAVRVWAQLVEQGS